MAQNFDFEASSAKVATAIETMEDAYKVKLPTGITTMQDVAETCGAEQLKKDVAFAANAFEEMGRLLKDLTGEEGDSVTNVTNYGLLQAIKKMDLALNGGV